MEKYYNDAIIGNDNILATLTEKGEMQRIYFPTKDNRQYINYFKTGVKINDSNLIYTDNDINNVYEQYYEENTNIVNTKITNTYFNLSIMQTDFAMIKENVIVRKYTFTNENIIDLNVNFLIHSELLSDLNNYVGAKIIDNGIMQYAHDFVFTIFAKGKKISSYQLNNTKNNIKSGKIQDKDYIGMSKDSSINFDIGTISPNNKKELEICIVIQPNNPEFEKVEREIERIEKIDLLQKYVETQNYWKKYLKEHNGLNLNIINLDNDIDSRILNIYKRSILLFPLLVNQETGGIIAAPEVDENMINCGRYAYCWPRDAVFITNALDILGMDKETEKFYSKFCKITQSRNGMWEQRFYTDGRLAPCWGYQIDETASVIYGVYNHYMYCKKIKFLKDNLHMCEKAVEFLKKYILDVFNNENKFKPSYDLWEMCEGVHLYSLASIFSAFDNMKKIYAVLGKDVSNFENNRLKEEKISKSIIEIEKMQIDIKKYIDSKLYNEQKNCYVRNEVDKKMDISILGLVTPFNVYSPNERKIKNTVEKINLTLRTYTGGYLRFEQDHYMNTNPWPIANMWMTLYYLEKGEKNKAKETFEFVIKSSGKHDLLGEQVNNSTMKPNWVLGLGWSHAMFIITLEKMLKSN